MRFLRLNLIATGPFTDHAHDLSQGNYGLHLIYGPNEAGKSSFLRAIGNFLFGFPHQTMDDFNHSRQKLRIGATLTRHDGTCLSAIRRKGRTLTLRDPQDDKPLDEQALRPFLGGVDRELFESMFGINHHRLRQGGEQIVKGEGKIGQLLFAAGAGLAGLNPLLNRLQDSSDKLVTRGGRSGTLLATIQQYKSLKTEINQSVAKIDQWNQLRKTLEQTAQTKAELDRKLSAAKREQHRLSQIQHAARVLSLWKLQTETCQQLKKYPLLDADFASCLDQARTDLGQAQGQLHQLIQRKQYLQSQLEGLGPVDQLLQHGDLLQELRERKNTYRQALTDIPVIQSNLALHQQQQLQVERELGLTALGDQRPNLFIERHQTIRLQQLGNEQSGLLERLKSQEQKLDQTRLELRRAIETQATLPPKNDLRRLQASLKQARQQSSVHQELNTLQLQIQQKQQNLNQQVEQLPLWRGSLSELQKQKLPLLKTVDQFQQKMTDLQQQAQTCSNRMLDQNERKHSLQNELAKLELARPLPSESELTDARQRRDFGWQLIYQQWKLKTVDAPELKKFLQQGDLGSTLETAFESAVQNADHLADDLRTHAQQVATKRKLLLDLELLGQQQQQLDQQLQQIESLLNDTNDQWNGLWAPLNILPLPPAEMKDWLRQAESIRSAGEQLVELVSKQQTLENQLEQARSSIVTSIQSVQTDFQAHSAAVSELSDYLSDIRDEQKEINDHQDRLQQSIRDLQIELESEESQLELIKQQYGNWKEHWCGAVASLQLPADASAEQVTARLQLLSELQATEKQLLTLQKQFEQHQRLVTNFELEVGQLRSQFLSDHDKLSPLEAFDLLYARFDKNEKNERRRNELTTQLNDLERQLTAAEELQQRSLTALHRLQQQAQVEAIQDLQLAIERSAERRQAQHRLQQLTEQLAEYCPGSELEPFIQEIEEEVQHEFLLAQRIEELDQETAGLDSQREKLIADLTALEIDFRKFDGNSQGMEKNSESQTLAAKIEELYHQWAVLKIAQGVLNRGMEEHREKHQAPVLNRASQIFKQITLEQFSGLRADFDDRGEQILKGIRRDSSTTDKGGSLIGVEGMSDGTCDQLYLALRLASLESWLDHHEPIPFIVDDVLINFDDDRSLATLQVLAELSHRTQVIFFTHHVHLVELVQQREIPDVIVHQL